jgi:glycosyltransferase involved in cell wall biosynthesis
MQRMLAALEDDLASIACVAPTSCRFWRGRVPIVSLDLWSDFRRACRRVGVPVGEPAGARLAKALRSKRVSNVLIHFADFAVRFEAVLRSVDKPIFVHCHGYDVTWDLHAHTLHGARCFDDAYPEKVRSLSQRMTFIANSRYTAAKLRAIGVDDTRIIQRYMGVPVPAEPPVRSNAPGLVRILYLGRLIDCKGPEHVIRAFELACERGLDARLVMAGDGPLGSMCALMCRHSPFRDRIELLGAVDERTGSKLRKEADIFTAHTCVGPLSRQTEQFGVAFVEALADGLPVVTGRAGAIEEIVEDGTCGILFEPYDIGAHADALLTLARNPDLRARMGHEGWNRANNVFPLTNETVKLREILGLSRRPEVAPGSRGGE